MDANQESNDKSQIQASEALLDEAEALIWSLLDDEIKPEDIKRLENLLQGDEKVRERYISCVQMHTDLHQHFQPTPEAGPADGLPSSPVLGSLGDLRPGTDTWPPVAE